MTVRKSLRGGVELEILTRDAVDVIVSHVLRSIPAGRNRTSIRPLEEPAVPIVLLDPESAFVHQPVMLAAEKHQV